MELTVALSISIISIVITVANFVLNRRDKAVKDAKETNIELIKFRLDELDKNVTKILDKLDDYDREIDTKIDKAMKIHIGMYHKKGE